MKKESEATGSNGEWIGAVILAAGASSRMGRPKQVLKYGGQTLVRRAALAAQEAGCNPIVVVTGAHVEGLGEELQGLNLREANNPAWESGMGSSIRAGIQAVVKTNDNVTALILMLCDQPFVTSQVLTRLITAHRETGHEIVASNYGETVGVPALFGREFFAELVRLERETGAKQVIQRHPAQVHLVPFPQGEIDLDTPADFAGLLSSSQS
ncbi:MAG: molybdenum cofactor cytidylyltransferase [Verrucomicrobiota bacterium]|jgi:molybdenum cofactor cytidylyltransferase